MSAACCGGRPAAGPAAEGGSSPDAMTTAGDARDHEEERA